MSFLKRVNPWNRSTYFYWLIKKMKVSFFSFSFNFQTIPCPIILYYCVSLLIYLYLKYYSHRGKNPACFKDNWPFFRKLHLFDSALVPLFLSYMSYVLLFLSAGLFKTISYSNWFFSTSSLMMTGKNQTFLQLKIIFLLNNIYREYISLYIE